MSIFQHHNMLYEVRKKSNYKVYIRMYCIVYTIYTYMIEAEKYFGKIR